MPRRPKHLYDVRFWRWEGDNRYEIRVGSYEEALELVKAITKRVKNSICFSSQSYSNTILCFVNNHVLYIEVESGYSVEAKHNTSPLSGTA